ncbi:hypothetical protein HWV62_44133 [Athelia sp. TMB]|nr:hypothetical protein HWV62_44133 [Athelia sp. TMB]
MSIEEQPPSKRQRVEAAPEAIEPTQIIRSDVWYDDGNVVLQAQGTQFKFYRGILAHSSSVFKDMFTIPQPASVDTQLVDGCPVVHLSDSAEEVRYILRALCPERHTLSGTTELPFAVLSAYLCLGQKYDIHELYHESKKRIFQDIPTTLGAYDAMPVGPAKYEYMELVQLARRTGLLSILPYAYFLCCQAYSTDQLIEGMQKSDGSTVLLSPHDQIICLAGFRGMLSKQAITTLSWLYDQDTCEYVCFTPESCLEARRAIIGQAVSPQRPLTGLDVWHTGWFNEELCQDCTDASEDMHNDGRFDFWHSLPLLFKLPPWIELLKERDESSIEA